MKFLDKVGLIVFANLVLILSVIICVVIFGWLDMGTVDYVLRAAFTDATSSNIILAVCALLILLAIKCIFFTSEDKEVNGVKDGILLQNADGQLVISKNTLEELVSNVVKGFDSAQNVSTRIELDKEKNLVVNVILNVKETAIIKELSTNLQTKIKTAIKKASDLEVKEVNISVKELKPQMAGEEIISEKEV